MSQPRRGADPALHTEPLGKHHDRAAFSCGVPALDGYLHRRASQEARRYVSATFVLCADGAADILGYYTLSALGIRLDALPDEVARKLPRYPDVPATLIGRLAVASPAQGRGLGAFLLVDALRRSLEQASTIGAAAVVVEAKDEPAARFYETYGFQRLPERPNRLFLPMTTVAKLF